MTKIKIVLTAETGHRYNEELVTDNATAAATWMAKTLAWWCIDEDIEIFIDDVKVH